MSETQVASPVAPASKRRRFLTGATAVAAGAAATVAMPNVSRAQTVTLKMQGAWGPPTSSTTWRASTSRASTRWPAAGW